MSITRNISLFFNKIPAIKEQLFSPKYLLYTNVTISISLSAAGDVLEQHYEILKGEWNKWSFYRTRNMAVSGMSIGILENNSWSELKEEVLKKAHRLYIAEWVIWPPAQLFNFYFLPTRYRVLYDNTISLGYDVYTSQVKHDNVTANARSMKL
ncbi:mpv17-like protein 2 isoform X3 [Ceratina calcarata]|uniref:Mpv17-like protein 2 isoform X3 n=1 Tax=Ceratina calcarata TaxID=156304 RepID=A0AAJ7SCU3_9HYME|nr:mpv17-like protein 2 isoform X3 [Ceratina calcarata]